ncbi:HMA2 domain-containing protein [Heyndrickxia sp. NPDC080065]|uniref:HMA2 domain-containing protein n=1 Tax=Heyndrickxia sp. NPDC080065 TaxID=3390568 RepID=UPI003D006399
MLKKVSEFLVKKEVERKLNKYNIALVHFIPGRIRLKSNEWKINESLITKITKQLEKEPFIFSIHFTKETGSLLVTYDSNFVEVSHGMEQWLQLLEQIYEHEYSAIKGGQV